MPHRTERKPLNLVGEWHGIAMGDPDASSRDVLVFKVDGKGLIQVFDGDHGFRESFRWSLESSTHLRLECDERTEIDPDDWTCQEVKSTLNESVGYGIREEDTETSGRMRVLRFATKPWPAMSDHYLFHRTDIPYHATFQAPCFVIEQEAAEDPFREKALSDYLAEQLEQRRIAVGPRYKVYKGFCYRRTVEIQGKQLGLAVNQDEDSGGWWLSIDRPALCGTVEAEELHRLVEEILRGVEGLSSLEWQTEEEWWGSW